MDRSLTREEGFLSPQSLHSAFRDGLSYFANNHFYYVVKEHAHLGLVYHQIRKRGGLSNNIICEEAIVQLVNQLRPSYDQVKVFKNMMHARITNNT